MCKYLGIYFSFCLIFYTLLRKRAQKAKNEALILHSSLFTSLQRLSLQFPASRTAALVATLASATLGDVLLARSSGSSLRVNLLPTHLVGELAAEGLARRPEGESQLRGYRATQSALAVGCVQHLGGCHV